MNKRQRTLTNSLAEMVAPVIAQRAGSVPASSAKVAGLSVRMSSDDTAEIMIYGRIGGSLWDEGITASSLAETLREAGNVANIHVRINSGGGDVFEGVAIHTALRRHAATVTTFVDGLAASAASFIAMAGDRIVIARGAMMMIHDGMTGTYGNGDAHRRSADLLDKVSNTIADLYAARAGEDADHWRALMTVNGEDGTWFTAAEAVDAGLADEMTDADEDAPATAEAALKQWSAVLQRAPESVRALLSADEQAAPDGGQEQSAPEQSGDEQQDNAPDAAQGVDQSDADGEHNADHPFTDEQDAEADIDFRFRMRMYLMQQHRAAA